MKTMFGRRRTADRAGFTLVELILVMLILATLAAIVVPKMTGRTKQAQVTAASSQIKNFTTVLDAFEIDNGYYPNTSDGLEPLVDEPNDAPNWRGPYMESIPLDPWKNAYIYEYPGKLNTRGYDIISMGPDGRSGTDDDITNLTDSSSKR